MTTDSRATLAVAKRRLADSARTAAQAQLAVEAERRDCADVLVPMGDVRSPYSWPCRQWISFRLWHNKRRCRRGQHDISSENRCCMCGTPATPPKTERTRSHAN